MAVKVYIKIAEICFYFEKHGFEADYYLNLNDYQVYSTEERHELIDSKTHQTADFLLIPKKESHEIVVKYLLQKNSQKLLRKKDDKDFRQKFHWYTEDKHLVEEWERFEEEELMSFASKWCEENQIKFTSKNKQI